MTHSPEGIEAIEKAIEECVGIMGNLAYQGSYAAPREAFEKVLTQYANAKVEEAKGRIALALHLLESDAGFESDCVAADVAQGREVSPRERMLAELVGRLYTLFHPTGDCSNPHPDWEEQNKKDIAYLTQHHE